MTTALIPAKWTIDEYHRLIADGYLDDKHVELINGEIVEMSPEGIPHASVSDRVEKYLGILMRDRTWLRVRKAITLPNNSEPEPDLFLNRRDSEDSQSKGQKAHTAFYPLSSTFCLLLSAYRAVY
jgi:Uma2 family endonuclease